MIEKMQPNKKSNHIFCQNNGFSLIELLLSISILAIIIVPLLNNFVTAAKANAEAKRIQSETIITQNFLEEIKAKSAKDIAKEFNYPLDFPLYAGEVYELKLDENGIFQTVNDTEKSSVKTVATDESGNSYYEYTFVDKADEPYYFAIKNIVEGASTYDALITLDGRAYISEDDAGNKYGYNAYEMPLISDINSEKNIVAMQTYEEDAAVTALYNNHITYCAEQEALHEGEDPPFTITYYSKTDIKNKIEKQITVDITSSGEDMVISIGFVYTCPYIYGTGSSTYTIVNKTMELPNSSIYIFYYPSYKDSILVNKAPSITDEVDLYVVKQESSVVSVSQTVDGYLPSGVQLHSNTSFGIYSTDLVKKDHAKNRIYDLKVQLYKAGTNFNSHDLCIEFKTTKEE
jgi:prepilin-type N-terminal cleavage/methylation domain-containing protein